MKKSLSHSSIQTGGNSSRRRPGIIMEWTLLTSAAWDLTSHPLLWSWLWLSAGERQAALVRGNESSTCCSRNVMVQTLHSSSSPETLGNLGTCEIPFGPFRGVSILLKCTCRRVEQRTGRCLRGQWKSPCLVLVTFHEVFHTYWEFKSF